MIIDVERLSEDGLEVSRDFEFASTDLVEENAVFFNVVHAKMTVKKIGEEIFVKGRISTRLSFVCSRCLSPFDFPVDSRFDLVFLPEELDIVKEQLENDDMERLFYCSRSLDLKEVVLEQLNLTFPFKPLCSPSCQGICPNCGKVIKKGGCSCVTEETDLRLEKLKIFMRDKK